MFENIPTTSSAQRPSPSCTHTLVHVVHTEGRGRWRDEKGKWGWKGKGGAHLREAQQG